MLIKWKAEKVYFIKTQSTTLTVIPISHKMATAARGAGGSAMSAAAAAASSASFNCTGAVRKAGFLSVKKWLLRKKHQVSEQPLKFRGRPYMTSAQRVEGG